MLKEYELLFQRSEKAQENRWRFMQLFLVASAAFYAALFSDDLSLAESPALVILVWIPVVFSFLGLGLAWALRQGMLERGNVMKAIEKNFGAPGWEGERELSHAHKLVHSPLTLIGYLFWAFAIFTTSAIALMATLGQFIPKD